MYKLLLIVVICAMRQIHAVSKRTTLVSKGTGTPLVHFDTIEEVKKRSKAMTELLDVLGLSSEFDKALTNPNHKRPPKYMVDLYNAVADVHGISRDKGLDADMVRSIPNKGDFSNETFHFEIGAIKTSEIVVAAELHFHLSKKALRQENRGVGGLHSSFRRMRETKYYIKVFKAFDNGTETLISLRRIPAHVSGWLIFPLYKTVLEMVNQATKTLSLRVEIASEFDHIINQKNTHQTFQPILVVFSNHTDKATLNSIPEPRMEMVDEEGKSNNNIINRIRRSPMQNKNKREKEKGTESKDSKERIEKKKMKNEEKGKTVEHAKKGDKPPNKDPREKVDNEKEIYDINYEENYDFKSESLDYVSDSASSNKQDSGYSTFSTESLPPASLRSCRRYPLKVDFEEMGWSGWIIHPRGYNAYHCKGKCSFPLSQHLKPTNHATVQSIMYTLGLGDQPVEMPCCVPDKLYDINLLYFDENDYVVLRRYEDMVVASCACA